MVPDLPLDNDESKDPIRPDGDDPGVEATEDEESEAPTFQTEDVVAAYSRFRERREANNTKLLGDIIKQLREMNYYLYRLTESEVDIDTEELKELLEDEE